MPKSLAQRAVEQRPGAGNVSVSRRVSLHKESIYVTDMSPKFIRLFDLRSSVCTLYTFF